MHEEPSLPQWWARGAALTPGVGAAPRTWPWGRRGHTFVTAGRLRTPRGLHRLEVGYGQFCDHRFLGGPNKKL